MPRTKTPKKHNVSHTAQKDVEINIIPSEKQTLLELYDRLNAMGIRSISDLENKIAKAE